MNKEVEQQIEDIIFEAAIMKAIQDNRELLAPSIQHFLGGGNVNGEFSLSLKKLMRWVEKKTIETCQEYLKSLAQKEAQPLLESLEYLMEGVRNLPPLSAIEGVLIPHFQKAQTAITNYKNNRK